MVLSLSNSTKTTRNLISLLMCFAVFCENWHHFFLKSLLFVGAQAEKGELCRGAMQHYFVQIYQPCLLSEYSKIPRFLCFTFVWNNKNGRSSCKEILPFRKGML